MHPFLMQKKDEVEGACLGALSTPVYWKLPLPMKGGWNKIILKVPSN